MSDQTIKSTNAPSEVSEKEWYEKGKEDGIVVGLELAKKHITYAREFLRGSSYSTDRLVGMMFNSINEHINDLTDNSRQLCVKNNNENKIELCTCRGCEVGI